MSLVHREEAADRHLPDLGPGDGEARIREGRLRHHHRGAELLVEALEAARDVDAVAERREPRLPSAADPAEDRRPHVDADAHPQRLADAVGELPVEAAQGGQHVPGGVERVPAAGAAARGDPEQGHDPVAQKLVDLAPVPLDGLAHELEVAVEEEHGIVGVEALGEGREAAQVREHDGDVALDPPAVGVTAERRLGRAQGDQRPHRKGVVGSHLAGEPHAGRRGDAGEGVRLDRVRRRQRVGALAHQDPAGGAAAAAAANGGVRHPAGAADLEERRAGRGAHGPPARIGDGRPAAEPVAQAQGDEPRGGDPEHGPHARLGGVDERPAPLEHVRGEVGLRPGQGEAAGGLDPAGDRDGRDEGGEDQQERPPGPVPAHGAQPEMQADDPVQPDHEEEEGLAEGEARPEQGEQERVAVVEAVERVEPAGRGDVGRGEEGDRQAEADLDSLPGRHAPGPTADQLPQAEAGMDRDRAPQEHGARGRTPEAAPHGLDRLHRLDRDVPDGVVEEMHEREDEEDEAGGEAPGLRLAPAGPRSRARRERRDAVAHGEPSAGRPRAGRWSVRDVLRARA